MTESLLVQFITNIESQHIFIYLFFSWTESEK